MKKLQLKTKISTIALILLLTLSAIVVALPTAIAQEPVYSKTTHAIIGATPNPVGINQPVLVHIGITDYLYVVTDGWEGLTVTVTDPEGIEITLGPYRTDATGGTGDIFVPTKVGTYTLQTHFPEQTYNWVVPPIFDPELLGVILYEASDSSVLELVVTDEQLPDYPTYPLPSEYWTRPIDAQHREWYRIAGNWVTTPPNRFAPYNDYAPETAHILWTKPMETGGLAGGTMEIHGYECGDAYEGKFSGAVIIGGILFYNRFAMGFEGGMSQQGVVAVDLYTGEELWFKNNTRIAFGQVFYWDSYNYHGVFDYLWAEESSFDFATFTFVTNWHAYDPFSGEWVYSMENMPSSGEMFGAPLTRRGPKGEIFIYTVDINDGWMTFWNSSRAVSDDGSWGSATWGRTIDAANGYEWNKTIPTGLPGGVVRVLEDRIIGNDVTGWSNIGDEPVNQWCISIETGDLMWQEQWQPPLGELSIGFGAASFEDGVFILEAKETRQVWGFDIDSGEEIWGPTESLPYLGIYGLDSYFAYGKLFVAAKMAGVISAYDAKNGSLLWTYEATDPYNEILWSNNWPVYPLFITDGKIYLGHSEHSPVDPKPRGAAFICLNATNGEVIWRADGLFRQTDWGQAAIIGDSIIATMDSYDQRIYAIGKGPSATTITASPEVSVHGSSVLIKGMVTDISPGTQDPKLALRFPNGVPAVADESMSDWMLYVYKQFERPADAVGVQVKLEAYDPNGNYQNLGTTTSDANGVFGFAFEPEVLGTYWISATFEGSNGYYGSTISTYITVDPAPSPATPIEPEESAAPFITTEVAILLAVVIAAVIGIVAFWAFKKRK